MAVFAYRHRGEGWAISRTGLVIGVDVKLGLTAFSLVADDSDVVVRAD